MTTLTAPAPTPPASAPTEMRLTNGRLPKWAPWALLGVSAVVTART